jgi:hypothetical protein
MQIIMISLFRVPARDLNKWHKAYATHIREANTGCGLCLKSNDYMDRVFPDYARYVRSWWWLADLDFHLIIDEACRLDDIFHKRNEAIANRFMSKKYDYLPYLMDEDDENYLPF